MSEMKRFLMVAPSFPPLGGISSLRMSRFARHLPAFGWEPVVITRRPDSVVWEPRDPGLLETLPSSRVVDTGFLDIGLKAQLYRKGDTGRLVPHWKRIVRLIPPDPFLGWVPFAYRACRRVMEEETIQAIMTTAPHRSTNLVGFAVRRYAGLPWLADLRDEWTHHPRRRLSHAWARRLDRRLERAILPEADAITVTSPAYGRVLQTEWGPDAAQRISVITNGYDRELFQEEFAAPNERFTLAFVGSLVGHKTRTFDDVRAAVEDLLAADVLDADRFCFRFVGQIRSRYEPSAGAEFGRVFEHAGFLPHTEAVREMRRADALLMVLSPARKLAIPGRTFEYLAARKPILAVVPKGSATAAVLESSGLATFVEPGDGKEAIGAALAGLFQAWQTGTSRHGGEPEGVLEQYEAVTLARSLAQRLDAITQA